MRQVKTYVGISKNAYTKVYWTPRIRRRSWKSALNSYHNFAITKLGKKLIKIACAEDGSIEAFKHFDKRILGIMWHPERYKKIKKFDLQFIKKNL